MASAVKVEFQAVQTWTSSELRRAKGKLHLEPESVALDGSFLRRTRVQDAVRSDPSRFSQQMLLQVWEFLKANPCSCTWMGKSCPLSFKKELKRPPRPQSR